MSDEDNDLDYQVEIKLGNASGTSRSAFVGSTEGYNNIQKSLRPYKRTYAPSATSGSTNRNCPVASAPEQVKRAYLEFWESRGITPAVLDPIVLSDMSDFRGHFDLTSSLLYFGNRRATTQQMLEFRFRPGMPTRYTLEKPYRDTYNDGMPIPVDIVMSNNNDLRSEAAVRKGIRISGIFRQGAPLMDYTHDGNTLSEEQRGFVLTFNPKDAIDAVAERIEDLDSEFRENFSDEERRDLLKSFRDMFQMQDTFSPKGLNVGYTIMGRTYTAVGYFERGESTMVKEDVDGLRRSGESADMVFRASVLTIKRDTLYTGTSGAAALIAFETHVRKKMGTGENSGLISFSGETAAIVSLIRYFMGHARVDSPSEVPFLEPLGGEGPRSINHIVNRILEKKQRNILVFQDIMSAVCLYTVLHFVIVGMPPDFLGTEVIDRQVTFFEIFNALGRKADLLWYGDDQLEHSPDLKPMLESISAGASRLKSYEVTVHN